MSIVDAWGCGDVDGEISSSDGNTYPVDGKNSFWIKEKLLFANFCNVLHVFSRKTIAII